MKKNTARLLLLLGLALVLAMVGHVVQSAGDNPHVVSRSSSQSGCIACHKETPKLKDDNVLLSKNLSVDLNQFSKDGVGMCSSCHNPNQGHKVGLDIDFPVPADLPLSEGNDISCLTCHYTHGRLDSDKPQASFSFMDRLVNAERLHKSFLLRRNNSDGELCLTCHNVNQGSKS